MATISRPVLVVRRLDTIFSLGFGVCWRDIRDWGTRIQWSREDACLNTDRFELNQNRIVNSVRNRRNQTATTRFMRCLKCLSITSNLPVPLHRWQVLIGITCPLELYMVFDPAVLSTFVPLQLVQLIGVVPLYSLFNGNLRALRSVILVLVFT